MIFRPIIPKDQKNQPYLAYASLFEVVPQRIPGTDQTAIRPNEANGMYMLKRAHRPNGERVGDIVLLQQILGDVEICPKFTDTARDWTCFTAREKSELFYLNHYCDTETFDRFVL